MQDSYQICITTKTAMRSAHPDVKSNDSRTFMHCMHLGVDGAIRKNGRNGRGPRTVATVVTAEMHLVLPPGH